MRNLYKYLPVVILIMAGCSEDERALNPSDDRYFPLRKGFYQVYKVEGANYYNIQESESFSYQLKTEVVDSFVNQQGGYTYTIHRSRRNTQTDPWQFQQVWSVRMNSVNVIVSEENTPFIKIIFPAVKNRAWNGNALNSMPADEYILAQTGKSYQLETGETVGAYIQIVQEDSFDPIIGVNQQQEIYVRDIGLVKREVTNLTYCTDADDCVPGTQVIDHGIVYVQTLLEYGQN